MPNGYGESIAEMSLEEKNKISHRGRATDKLIKYLLKK
jgi:XTP/dITP diphosphohydrolase